MIKKYSIIFFLVFIIHMMISDLLFIGGVKPDFLLIFIIYFSVREGSFTGVIAGFLIGVLSDLFSASLIFGVIPLVYSLTGYLTGYLRTRHNRLLPLSFYGISYGIILFVYFVYAYFNYQYLLFNDFNSFLITYLKTAGYTLVILSSLQLVFPLRISK